jgi:DNA-binding GntR family transcriptional regulator
MIPAIADAVRHMVLEGRLQQGQVVHQTNVARELGVSPVPLREALRRLETEGLITFLPYRGTIVTPVTGREIREGMEGTIALGSVMLPAAMDRYSAQQLARLRDLAQRLDTDLQEYEDFRTFYILALEPAAMPLLLGFVLNIIQRAIRVFPLTVANRKALRDVRPTRLDLVEALASGDVPRARATWAAYHEVRRDGLIQLFGGQS